MMQLHRSLRAYGSPAFAATLQRELADAGTDALGLQQALRTGNIVLEDDLGLMILRVDESPARLDLHLGLFFSSIVSGCACADDPTPVGRNTEYCEVDLEVDRTTAEARITLRDG
jgi:hypothetical protein